jgi:hypothetical protein
MNSSIHSSAFAGVSGRAAFFDRNVELLKDLSGRPEFLGLNRLKRPSILTLFAASRRCRIHQDIGVEEAINVHVSLPGSKFSALASGKTLCSTAEFAPVHDALDPRDLQCFADTRGLFR